MKFFRNLISDEIRLRVLDEIKELPDWQDNIFVPSRLTVSIDKFPYLAEIIDTTFAEADFVQGRSVYFARYPEGTQCEHHHDPSRFTLIVLMQDCEDGDLHVNGEKIDLNAGDAVLFRGHEQHYVSNVTKGERVSLAVWFG